MRYFLLSVLLSIVGALGVYAQEDVIQEKKAYERFQTDTLAFEANGKKLVGLFDRPLHPKPVATIIIVHGYGKTNVVEDNWYYDLRSRFAGIGINTLVWDKPGCGRSEGVFDIDQPVESSAREVVAAVRALQETNMAGTEHIGLWGISRAGWIAPLAIQEEASIAFWISVSGTDDKENARYLLESNLPLEGRTPEETALLVSEWQAQFNAAWQGGSYEQYLQAAPNLRSDPFIKFMGWGGQASEEEFLAYQDQFERGELVVDEQAELMVYVPAFEDILASIDVPVLALFGEKDTNVNWRNTAALYEKTLGANPAASLTIKTFPNANHNLKKSKTGGIREMLEQSGNTPYTEEYYPTMFFWLKKHLKEMGDN